MTASHGRRFPLDLAHDRRDAAAATTRAGLGVIACYYGETAVDDPLAVPEASPALLAKFPPTLFITASRAGELSSAIHSHIQLLKAGVDAEIAIWDGLDHAFLNNPDVPESCEAYDVVVKFFDKHLQR